MLLHVSDAFIAFELEAFSMAEWVFFSRRDRQSLGFPGWKP
jgi:hypothetical protein